MTESLRSALHRAADDVDPPVFDLETLVTDAHRLQRRRRAAMVAGAVLSVMVIGAGTLALAGQRPHAQGPTHQGPPSGHARAEAGGARPLVYARGRTVHVGERVVTAESPVAFIAPTDDGAVYEAMLDSTLWFTDGKSTTVIGTSQHTAAPTAHIDVVATSDTGSLVAWADAAGRPNRAPRELVVYDTSDRQEVARVPLPESDVGPLLLHLDLREVWFAVDGDALGRIYRYDLSAERTLKESRDALQAALERSGRTFTAETASGQRLIGTPAFAIQGSQLLGEIRDEFSLETAPGPVVDGEAVHWRLPPGYEPPADGEGGISVAQWLDDTHVVLFSDDGGGDLPAKRGDFLTCPIPSGTCEIAVPRTDEPFVAPYPS